MGTDVYVRFNYDCLHIDSAVATFAFENLTRTMFVLCST